MTCELDPDSNLNRLICHYYYLEDGIPVSKCLVPPPFISHFHGHLESEQPNLAHLVTMAINHVSKSWDDPPSRKGDNPKYNQYFINFYSHCNASSKIEKLMSTPYKEY